jgi:hypothetical protein
MWISKSRNCARRAQHQFLIWTSCIKFYMPSVSNVQLRAGWVDVPDYVGCFSRRVPYCRRRTSTMAKRKRVDDGCVYNAVCGVVDITACIWDSKDGLKSDRKLDTDTGVLSYGILTDQFYFK